MDLNSSFVLYKAIAVALLQDSLSLGVQEVKDQIPLFDLVQLFVMTVHESRTSREKTRRL